MAAPRLKGAMGPAALMLAVLAFSAPMAVVEGFIPYAIRFGGPGAVFAFALTTGILILFALGYIAMTRRMTVPGNFHAVITAGLGREAGLGAAFLAIFGYLCVLGGNYVFFGISVSGLVSSFGGPESHWLAWSLAGLAAATILGHFNIEFSARILTWAMAVEVLIVAIFCIAVFARGGAEGLSAAPFAPGTFLQGNMAVTLLFTILVFLGFEATALFRDEVRDPDRTIPRATYGAVIFIGLLYVAASYAMVSAHGASAWQVATEDPVSMFPDAIGAFVHPVFKQLAYGSVVLSIFAASVSIHNVAARYILALAALRALPGLLAAVHARHVSPHMASAAVGTIAGLTVLGTCLGGIDGTAAYAVVIGIGAIAIIALMGLASFAVTGWFLKTGIPAEEGAFRAVVAPGIAGAVLAGTVAFACLNLEYLVGGAPGQSDWILLVLAAVFLAGTGAAGWFRLRHPRIYAGLGGAG